MNDTNVSVVIVFLFNESFYINCIIHPLYDKYTHKTDEALCMIHVLFHGVLSHEICYLRALD